MRARESEWFYRHSIMIAEDFLLDRLCVGDLVYCSKELCNILLEVPNKDALE